MNARLPLLLFGVLLSVGAGSETGAERLWQPNGLSAGVRSAKAGPEKQKLAGAEPAGFTKIRELAETRKKRRRTSPPTLLYRFDPDREPLVQECGDNRCISHAQQIVLGHWDSLLAEVSMDLNATIEPPKGPQGEARRAMTTKDFEALHRNQWLVEKRTNQRDELAILLELARLTLQTRGCPGRQLLPSLTEPLLALALLGTDEGHDELATKGFVATAGTVQRALDCAAPQALARRALPRQLNPNGLRRRELASATRTLHRLEAVVRYANRVTTLPAPARARLTALAGSETSALSGDDPFASFLSQWPEMYEDALDASERSTIKRACLTTEPDQVRAAIDEACRSPAHADWPQQKTSSCRQTCLAWSARQQSEAELRAALKALAAALMDAGLPLPGATFSKPGRIFLSAEQEAAYARAFVTKRPLPPGPLERALMPHGR